MSDNNIDKTAAQPEEVTGYGGQSFKELLKPKANGGRAIPCLILAIISLAASVHKVFYYLVPSTYDSIAYLEIGGEDALAVFVSMIFDILLMVLITASASLLIAGSVHYFRRKNANVMSVSFILFSLCDLIWALSFFVNIVVYNIQGYPSGLTPNNIMFVCFITICSLLHFASFFFLRRGRGNKILPIVACVVNFTVLSVLSFPYLVYTSYGYFYAPDLVCLLSMFIFTILYRREKT